MQFRRPEFFPTLCFIASLCMFVALGGWQVQRLHWKKAVMAASAEAQEMPVLGSLPQDVSGLLYRRVKLTGTFLHDKTIHLIGRQQGMDVGYYMVTPLLLDDDGRVILVNRGFSPPGRETKPKGVVTVEGMLRAPRQKRTFVPDNVPEKNIWTYEDMDAISGMVGKAPLPVVVEVTGAAEKNVFPIPHDGTVVFRNDHLGYAVTWFGMAIVSVVMFAAYYRKK